MAITGTNGDGVAVIDLSSIPEPAPLPYDLKLGRLRASFTSPNPPPRRAVPPSSERTGRFAASLRRTIPHVTTDKFLSCCLVRPARQLKK